MLLAMRTDRALRPGRCRIVDDAISIDGEVDHAVPRLEKDLRLRSRHRLIGDEVTDRPATIGRRIVVVWLSPGLEEMSRAVADPVTDVEILDGSRRHRPARRKRHGGERDDQRIANLHERVLPSCFGDRLVDGRDDQ